MFEHRLEPILHRILDGLDELKIEATFLCLGWIGEEYPHLIREISSRGHEVGSHTHMHGLVNNQRRDYSSLQDKTPYQVYSLAA